jgi:hypothetical protein
MVRSSASVGANREGPKLQFPTQIRPRETVDLPPILERGSYDIGVQSCKPPLECTSQAPSWQGRRANCKDLDPEEEVGARHTIQLVQQLLAPPTYAGTATPTVDRLRFDVERRCPPTGEEIWSPWTRMELRMDPDFETIAYQRLV